MVWMVCKINGTKSNDVSADINECENETTNNCLADVELCINSIGSYDCCNASEPLCQQRAGNITSMHFVIVTILSQETCLAAMTMN